MASVSTIIDTLMDKFGNNEGQLVIPQDELVKALGSMKVEKSGREKKPKKEKDSNAPKRPSSVYMLWLNDNREMIKDTHFPKNENGDHTYPSCHEKEGEPLTGRDKITLITKKGGELWNEVSEEDKEVYKNKFTELSDTYKSEMITYKEENGDYTRSNQCVKYDIEDIPDAPDGWSGPFKMTYLPKVSKNPETDSNFKAFKTFEEAVECANNIEEGCSGITKTSTGYSLRIGPELRINPEKDFKSGIASWTKGEEAPSPVDRTPNSSPKSSPKMKKKSLPKKSSSPEKEVEPKKKKSLKKKIVKETTPPPIEESDDDKSNDEEHESNDEEHESNDESDDEELEVEPVTLDGVEYFMDSSSGDIYDKETQEIVGKSENGVHKIF